LAPGDSRNRTWQGFVVKNCGKVEAF